MYRNSRILYNYTSLLVVEGLKMQTISKRDTLRYGVREKSHQGQLGSEE